MENSTISQEPEKAKSPQKSTWENLGATIKGILVVILTLALLIPASMIHGLIRERQGRRVEAINEISAKWGNEQTIIGPIISVPYVENLADKDSKSKWMYYHFLPENLSVEGNIIPEKRYRGIFEVVVYRTTLKLAGNFMPLDIDNSGLSTTQLMWDKAAISLGIPDLRGIEEQIEMDWNGQKLRFNSGLPAEDVFKKGVSVYVDLSAAKENNQAFALNLDIKGSQELKFVPIGKVTTTNISSTWSKPSFDGAFLPDERTINEKGFTAKWKILHLNRPYPQSWANGNYAISESSYGVNLLSPIDNYDKISRAIQYAILIIGLTFLIFFFIELLNDKAVHIIQYALVGFALSVFYTLLLSISEHLNFNMAYLIAAIMTIILIAGYANGILKEKKLALLIGSSLTMLYGFVFIILQMEDYALLTGSLGIFATLAVIMYVSGKIDWQRLGKR